MRVWLERQIELRGFYNINLTSTALALALASRHPALAEVQARPLFRPPSTSLAAVAGIKPISHGGCDESCTHQPLDTAKPCAT